MVRSSVAEDARHGSRASIRRGHRSDVAGVDHGLIERFDHNKFIRAFLGPHRRRLGTSVEYTDVADQIEDWATGPDADRLTIDLWVSGVEALANRRAPDRPGL
ncbi:MAG: hypothetical protein AABZ33_13150 [Chloroflexota bacterium]